MYITAVLIFHRSVTFSPEVELTINYCGKRVQFSHGPLMGLIMGLSHLNCSKIRLKKINYRRGLLGIDRVLFHLIKEWLNHIQNSQLPSLLQGIGPMNSIVIFCEYKNIIQQIKKTTKICIIIDNSSYIRFSAV